MSPAHVPDCHILDHAAAKRAIGGSTNLAGHAALAASFNPNSIQADKPALKSRLTAGVFVDFR